MRDKMETCAFCGHGVISSKPVKAHNRSFCNFVCLVGYEGEKEDEEKKRNIETPLHC